jgi:hypothetical protein
MRNDGRQLRIKICHPEQSGKSELSEAKNRS